MLPDNSIDCVVTSPPYWGLRDYGNAAITIWGGDPNCEHEWSNEVTRKLNLQAGNPEFQRPWRETASGVSQGAFCIKCGAWRGQLGHEPTPELYVEHLVEIFREVRRVLKPEGTLWLNLGDSYWANRSKLCETGGVGKTAKCGREHQGRAGFGKHEFIKPKDLVGIPWRVAFALQADGWWLRSDIIWAKPNAMPESVKDRPTKAHEYVFLLTKSQKYYYDIDAIREPHITAAPNKLRNRAKGNYNKSYPGGRFSEGERPEGHPLGRNKRTVWWIPTKPFKGAHFAVFPPELAEIPIKAGCPEGGIVLDPFMGSGTVAVVAQKLGRNYIGFEINPDYVKMAEERILNNQNIKRSVI
jgi:DNA modification methylase